MNYKLLVMSKRNALRSTLYALCLILFCVFAVNCVGSIFGGKTSPAEVKKACSEALNETTIKGDLTIYKPTIDRPEEPMTGTLIGKLNNQTESHIGNPNNYQNRSMVVLLINLLWKWLMLQVLGTWIITILLNLKGINVSKRIVSIGFNVLILGGSQLIVRFTNWIPYNWLDVALMQLGAFGIQVLLYDWIIKKHLSKKEGI